MSKVQPGLSTFLTSESTKQRETELQTRTGRERETERDSVQERKGDRRQRMLSRPGYSQTPGLGENASERGKTISANTNISNGSKMEFTRAWCYTGAAKKTVSLNQRPEWQQKKLKQIPASVKRNSKTV